MNIALFTDVYPPYINGVSTSCYNLVRTLRDHGHKVIVVTPRYESGKLEYKDGVIRMPGIANPKWYGYRFTKIYDRKIIKILQEEQIELIHNQTDSTVGFFARKAAKKLKIPLVYTYHTAYEDYSQYASNGYLDRIFKGILRIYSKFVANNATEYITPSLKTKEYMRGLKNDIYMNVIPTGIDFSIFSNAQRDYEKERQFKLENGIGENTTVFLILGRMGYEKSVDVVIKCMAKYLEKHPEADIKIIAVGDGPQKEDYELLSHELRISQYIKFVGAKPASEVPFFYHLADIYTSASISETQGLTFMEAMASEAIVLARYDNNLTDTIVEGNTGFFYNDEDSFVLKVDRILSLSKEEKQKVKDNAKEMLERYSIERFYNSIMEVYKRAQRKFW